MESSILSKPRKQDPPGTKVIGENPLREYKSICKGGQGSFLQKVREILKNHINQILSLLNCQGGTIYFGIHETTRTGECVIEEGLPATQKERDDIDQEIATMFSSRLEYFVKPKYFSTEWIPMPNDKFRLNLKIKKFPRKIGEATKVRMGSITLPVTQLFCPENSLEKINAAILAHYTRKMRALNVSSENYGTYADKLEKIVFQVFSTIPDLPQWFISEIITQIYYFCGRMKSDSFPSDAVCNIKNILYEILNDYGRSLENNDLNMLGHIIFIFINVSIYHESRKYLSAGGAIYRYAVTELGNDHTGKISFHYQNAKEVMEKEDKTKFRYLCLIEQMIDVKKFSEEEFQLEKDVLDLGYEYF